MSVALTLDIRIWRPGQEERHLSATEICQQHQELQQDSQFMQALMIDNLGCNLVIDGQIVSRCTCMYDGESSPDLMYLFEEHIPNLLQNKPVLIHFFEDLTAWQFTPDPTDPSMLLWAVLDTSQGEDAMTVEVQGRCPRQPLIDSALQWLSTAVTVLQLYHPITQRLAQPGAANEAMPAVQDLSSQLELIQKLQGFCHSRMRSLGWQPPPEPPTNS
jgi:hypothetical protein